MGELQLPEDHDTQTLCQGAGEFILRGMVGNVGCLAHCYGPFGPCITIPGAVGLFVSDRVRNSAIRDWQSK